MSSSGEEQVPTLRYGQLIVTQEIKTMVLSRYSKPRRLRRRLLRPKPHPSDPSDVEAVVGVEAGLAKALAHSAMEWFSKLNLNAAANKSNSTKM